VGNPKEGDFEIVADLDDGITVDFDDFDVVFDAGVLQFMADESRGEARGVDDGDVDATDEKRNTTNVVFVTVGDEKGFDLAPIVLEIGVIGDDVIDAREIGFRETDASVHDDE